jgi:uncharacterized protein (DUF427 family)
MREDCQAVVRKLWEALSRVGNTAFMRQPARVPPQPGQESVWDYPRPPRLERVAKRLRVVFGGRTIADTTAGWRVLETSHPPVFYIPRADIEASALEPVSGSSYCEFKGRATYFDVVAGGELGISRAVACVRIDREPRRVLRVARRRVLRR